jgi:hypothetical protein
MFKISSQLELDQNLSLKISDTDSETEKFLIISSDNLVVEICWFDHFQFAWYSKASLHPRQTNSARLLFWKKLKKWSSVKLLRKKSIFLSEIDFDFSDAIHFFRWKVQTLAPIKTRRSSVTFHSEFSENELII